MQHNKRTICPDITLCVGEKANSVISGFLAQFFRRDPVHRDPQKRLGANGLDDLGFFLVRVEFRVEHDAEFRFFREFPIPKI